MEQKIITISREFCSGGRIIGRMVAEKLGIPFYDKELVDHIALESGFAPNYVEEHGEHSPSTSIFSYAFTHQSVPGVMDGLSTADYLWNAQCGVILQLAEKGPCVIVGRNADYVLKDRENCIHAYIYADKESRTERFVQLYGEAEKNPTARLAERDKRRRVNYHHYTGRAWGDPRNYDVCLNSSRLGIETCADIITSLAQK